MVLLVILTILYVLSAIFTTRGFWNYIQNLYRKNRLKELRSKISAISWTIWLLAELMNGVTCLLKTTDFWELTFAAICSVAALIIVISAFYLKLFAKPGMEDLAIACVLAVAGFVWWKFGDESSTNNIVLFAIGIGYVSTVRGIANGSLVEKPKPWFLVGLGSIFILLAYALQKDVTPLNIHFAVIACIGEFAVGVTALLKERNIDSSL